MVKEFFAGKIFYFPVCCFPFLFCSNRMERVVGLEEICDYMIKVAEKMQNTVKHTVSDATKGRSQKCLRVVKITHRVILNLLSIMKKFLDQSPFLEMVQQEAYRNLVKHIALMNEAVVETADVSVQTESMSLSTSVQTCSNLKLDASVQTDNENLCKEGQNDFIDFQNTTEPSVLNNAKDVEEEVSFVQTDNENICMEVNNDLVDFQNVTELSVLNNADELDQVEEEVNNERGK